MTLSLWQRVTMAQQMLPQAARWQRTSGGAAGVSTGVFLALLSQMRRSKKLRCGLAFSALNEIACAVASGASRHPRLPGR